MLLLLSKITIVVLAFLEVCWTIGAAIWFTERELLQQIKESGWWEIIMIIIPAFFVRSITRVIVRFFKKAICALVEWIIYKVMVATSIDTDYIVIDDKENGGKNYGK